MLGAKKASAVTKKLRLEIVLPVSNNWHENQLFWFLSIKRYSGLKILESRICLHTTRKLSISWARALFVTKYL